MILVTGASGGVGTALCRELAARGEDLALTARDRGKLEQLAEQVRAAGGTATVHPCDLRDQVAVAALAEELLATRGAPSAIVSLAGHSLRRSLADTVGRPHDLVRLTGTNMLGPAALLLALLPAMSAAGGGRVVVVTSASARIPAPGWAAYGASKAGLDAWLRAVRPEAERVGVRITVVELPLVATAMAAPTYGEAPRGALSPRRAAARVLRGLDRAPALISPPWARLGAVLSQAAPALAARGAGAGAELAQRLAVRGRTR
ncbi:SDR family oxidoreductase [Brachybacterium sp. EE-P12]|uniref:SDR family NAD(P)-dependent oxidoreductase n=1 Tax=Brachybacterium sp. EE-P12 TaxID=2306299 RepID=UPI000F08C122|nr:SDR family NAD(P)-dependent oxidoreductase [Brachybacterium sp. EE-P12]